MLSRSSCIFGRWLWLLSFLLILLVSTTKEWRRVVEVDLVAEGDAVGAFGRSWSGLIAERDRASVFLRGRSLRLCCEILHGYLVEQVEGRVA